MKLYIAGPMQGIANFNYPAFNRVTKKYRELGYECFNPAEKDIEHHGKDISIGNDAGSILHAVEKHGFSLRRALRDDLCWIAENADGIVMLLGWENSKGATAEHALARALGLRFYYE